MKKYEIVNKRVKALRDFADIRKGDVGGFVDGEHNLSHEGNCWIYDCAEVYDTADEAFGVGAAASAAFFLSTIASMLLLCLVKCWYREIGQM